MAETYSQSVTAMNANNVRYTPAPLTIGDSAAGAGGQQSDMRTGTQILCKGPDGAQRWYTIDPIRSVPGGSLVLQAV
jgi:hypothetical protein